MARQLDGRIDQLEAELAAISRMHEPSIAAAAQTKVGSALYHNLDIL
jgi:hypothetical protein